MSSVFTVNIKPDLKYIETFSDTNGLTIPNESHTITGTVEINLICPIQVRQLYVQFQGYISCNISALDFLQDRITKPDYGDEIPLNKWETIDSSKFGIVDKLSKRALGYSSAIATIVKQRVFLIDNKVQDLPVGKSVWPFSLTVQNVNELPPSLISPHHQIQYFLSARVKFNSFSERFKISYLSIIHAKPRNETPSVSFLSDESAYLINQSTLVKSKNNCCSQVIQFYRHSYPGLHSLYYLPRIRYRGARQDHIKYEISMSKFVCLQKRTFPFKCQFEAVCSDAMIASMDYYLEQIECYPIRAGDYTNVTRFEDIKVTRRRRLCRLKCDMSDYRNGSEIKLYLKLNIPHISPSIETQLLQITHKLRLIVRFKNEIRERNMSLSFPLVIGTVPTTTTTTRETNYSVDESPMHIEDVHVRQELDQWLLSTDQDELSYFDNNKLPSYHDVLLEGNPPSPFIEDNL